jgi:hypothetical protein
MCKNAGKWYEKGPRQTLDDGRRRGAGDEIWLEYYQPHSPERDGGEGLPTLMLASVMQVPSPSLAPAPPFGLNLLVES